LLVNSGISALPDGRIMVTGGNSDYKTSLFDPATGDWSVGPPMNIPRGYQVRQPTLTAVNHACREDLIDEH
jgi:hypothetical protein